MLLGSSGVGKSTIVNALVGEELLATQEVREDDHARPAHDDAPRADPPARRRRRARHAGDARAAALGRRPRAGVRRRRGDRAALPVLGLRPRSASRAARSARRSRTARSPRERWESYSKLQRELEAIEAPPQPPPASGARSGVQDSRTAEQTARRSTDTAPRLRRMRSSSRCPIPSTASRQVVLGQEVARPRHGPAFAWATASGVSASRGRSSTGSSTCSASTAQWCARPGEPAPRGRPVRRQVGRRVARVRRSGVARHRSPTPARSSTDRAALPPSRRPRAGLTLLDAGAARRTTRRSSSSTTAPSTREYAGLTRFLDAMSWEERIPPLRAALIQPVDRNETYSASALYAAALVRELLPELQRIGAARQAHRDGGEPRRARDAARARPPPAGVRRPAAPVGQLLPPALRQAGVELPALPAHHALRRHRAPRRRRRATPIPVAITCGTAEENRANNHAVAAALVAQGYPAWLARDPRRAHLDVLARRASTRTCPRLIEAVATDAARVDRDRRRHGARLRPLRPAAWSRSRPRTARSTTGRTAAWSTRSAPLLDAGPGEALLRRRRSTARAGRAATCRSRSARGATATTSGGC